jgi:hypothetical protein
MKVVIKNRKAYRVIMALFILLIIVRVIAMLVSLKKTPKEKVQANNISYVTIN